MEPPVPRAATAPTWQEELGWARVPGGHKLRIAWTRPAADGPHPAVLLLPPLSPRSWCGPLLEASPRDAIAALSRSWADAGWVTLRVDPSGVGDSGGPAWADVDLEQDLAGHVAALDALRALPWVDPARVFLFGASLGGFLAPLVASGRGARGIVVYGTPARAWSESLAIGARTQLALAGLEGAALEREAADASRFYRLLLGGEIDPVRLASSHPDLAGSMAARDLAGDRLHGRSVRYFRDLDLVDPEQAWRAAGAAVLALQGEHDWIVADGEHERIAAWADAGGGACVARTLAGLDHDLLRHPSRQVAFARRGRGEVDGAPAAITLAWMRARAAMDARLATGDAEGEDPAAEDLP